MKFDDKVKGQFIRFCLVGLTNTLIDFSVYLLLTRFFGFWSKHYLVANFIAFSTAATWSYFFNKYWTFQDQAKPQAVQFIKFFAVSLIGLCINETILFSLVHFLKLYDLIAKACAIAVVTLWNFSANKYWTFKIGISKSKPVSW